MAIAEPPRSTGTVAVHQTILIPDPQLPSIVVSAVPRGEVALLHRGPISNVLPLDQLLPTMHAGGENPSIAIGFETWRFVLDELTRLQEGSVSPALQTLLALKSENAFAEALLQGLVTRTLGGPQHVDEQLSLEGSPIDARAVTSRHQLDPSVGDAWIAASSFLLAGHGTRAATLSRELGEFDIGYSLSPRAKTRSLRSLLQAAIAAVFLVETGGVTYEVVQRDTGRESAPAIAWEVAEAEIIGAAATGGSLIIIAGTHRIVTKILGLADAEQ